MYKFKIFNDRYDGKNAEYYYQTSVSLPIYHGLKYHEQSKVIKLLKTFFKNYL